MVKRAAAAAAIAYLVVSSVAGAGARPIRRLWVADAVCETGSRPPAWYSRAGVYEGGIRFYHSTWVAWRVHVPAARRFAHADQAPAWAQAAVAEWGLRNVGRWGCLFHADVWAAR